MSVSSELLGGLGHAGSSRSYARTVTDLENPVVRGTSEQATGDLPAAAQLSLDNGREVALHGVDVREVAVFNVGLACCAVEIAAAAARPDSGSSGSSVRLRPYAAGPGEADVLVVSGTVTDAMAPAVRRLYERLAQPAFVVSYGACSNSGGPYWDSYSVTKGVDQIVPVDIYVPGCPPRPEALLAALRDLPGRRTSPGAAGSGAAGSGATS